MDKKSFDKCFIGANRAIIGHNRYATTGGVSKASAHPFEFPTLVGVHNGTLNSKYKYDDTNLYTVDSQAFYHQVDKTGIRDAVGKTTGAYCFVWWDKEEETINFLRNKERPLWMVYTVDGKTLFWASELWMLEGILGRNGIACEEAYFLAEDTHISIAVDCKGELGKPRASNLKGADASTVPYLGARGGGAHYQQKALTVVPKDVPKDVPEKVVEKKKEESPPQIPYEPSGHVSLMITSHTRDEQGSKYFKCVDLLSSTQDIRLYYTRLPMAEDDVVGGTLVAVVGNKKPTSRYYKVIYNSVNWDDLSFPAAEEEDKAYDHINNEISKEDFYKKYTECCWCSNPVFHNRKHALTTQGQAVCEDCCEDKEVMQYVKIAGSVRNKTH